MRSWSSTTANRLVSLPGPTCWASSSTENGFSAGGSGRLWRSGWLPGPPGCERGQGEANERADGVLDGIHRHEQQHAAAVGGWLEATRDIPQESERGQSLSLIHISE